MMKSLTPSELKALYLSNNPEGHFFERSTMRFFGDSMANFGCYIHDGNYHLYRKKAVKHGLKGGFVFSASGDFLEHY